MAKKYDIPTWEKYALTIDEAAAYFHIGEKRLRQIVAENPGQGLSYRMGTGCF